MHLLDISAVDDSMMIEGCNEVQLHFKLILTSGVGGEINLLIKNFGNPFIIDERYY